MISSLRGRILAVSDAAVVIDVGGVGMRCEVPPSAVSAIVDSAESGEVTVATSLVVREDSLTLYGFRDAEERDGFEVLMTVTGIGPRLALGALSDIGLDELRRAVAEKDLKTLERISGVGKKTAQRMVLEIGEKLGPPSTPSPTAPAGMDQGMTDAVQAALEQLGWPRAVATRTTSSLEGTYNSIEQMLRAALTSLGANHA